MRRSLFGAAALAAVAMTAVLIGTASAAKPSAQASNSNCPTGTKNLKEALNVGASYDGGTYSVERFGPAAQTSLVKYCVYANVAPSALDATAEGADGSAWTASKLAKTFSFSRPGGEPTNLALTGSKQEVGTATFGAPLTKNDIVLHISDAGQCFDIYGAVTPTCFVTPGEEPGPVCDDGTGNTAAAYNAIPTDVEHCSPPSLGFEANEVNEFGDEVTLNTSGGTKLVSMRVDFQSYGCSESGHWNTSDCMTTNFGTDKFSIPASGTDPAGITASIYDPNVSLTAPIATSTINPNIPYRPSADNVNCTGADAGKWFDAVSGACNNSVSVPLTFNFPGTQTLPNTVVWTVKFNTSHEGYNPIGEGNPCNSAPGGCGYDSLNVGAKSYPNAPYAGGDVNDDAFISWAANGDVLATDAGWAANRPLGEIVLGP
jgi:hypothetical protein